MNLQTILTNIPKDELRKTSFWRILHEVGEILRMVLVILVLIGFPFLYIALCFISPGG